TSAPELSGPDAGVPGRCPDVSKATFMSPDGVKVAFLTRRAPVVRPVPDAPRDGAASGVLGDVREHRGEGPHRDARAALRRVAVRPGRVERRAGDVDV